MSIPLRDDQHAYLQVADILRNQIIYNQLTSKVPSSRELSEIYSINLKTADKAVDLLRTEGLVHRLRGKGTFVAGSNETESDYPLVGLLLSDIINPNFALLAETVQRLAHTRRLAVLVYANSGRLDRTCEILDIFRKKSVCAVIVQGGAIRAEQVRTLVLQAGFPLIGDHTHVNGIDDVWIDVRAGAQMATTHLLEIFGPPVAYVSGSNEPMLATGRYQGYRDAQYSCDLAPDPALVREAAPTYSGGAQAVRAMLTEGLRPRAVFLYNLAMAMGAVSAITTFGLSIPSDIAVAGCDDSIPVDEMVVPTTTVAFSYHEEAKQLLTLLERRLHTPSADPLSIRIPPKLLVRSSSSTYGKHKP